jgi:preprotein translocase SecE subunit
LIAALKQQIKSLKLEVFDRVDWPKPDRVRSATYAVVFVSVFVGTYLYLSDRGISYLLAFVMPKH